MYLLDRVKILLTGVKHFLSEVCLKVTHPHVDLGVANIRWQIAAEWSKTYGHNGEPIENHHRSFHDDPLTTSPSLKMGSEMHPHDKSNFERPCLRNGSSDPLHVWLK